MFKDLIHIISSLVSTVKELSDLRKAEFEWFKSHANLATKDDLVKLEHKIMMTATQLETLLNNQTTQIGKIAKEQSDRFDALTKAIKDLQDLLNAGNVTPEVEAAANKVQAALQSLDDSIPDAPVPTP